MRTVTIICPKCDWTNPPSLTHCELCGKRIRNDDPSKPITYTPDLFDWLIERRQYGTVAGIVTGFTPIVVFAIYAWFNDADSFSSNSDGLLKFFIVVGAILGSICGAIFGTLFGLIGRWVGRKIRDEQSAKIGQIVGGVIGGSLLWIALLILVYFLAATNIPR